MSIQSIQEEARERVYDILGLEVDPSGQDEMYLIRDEDGEIIEGIDFREELDQIVALISSSVQKGREEATEEIQKLSGIVAKANIEQKPINPHWLYQELLNMRAKSLPEDTVIK